MIFDIFFSFSDIHAIFMPDKYAKTDKKEKKTLLRHIRR